MTPSVIAHSILIIKLYNTVLEISYVSGLKTFCCRVYRQYTLKWLHDLQQCLKVENKKFFWREVLSRGGERGPQGSILGSILCNFYVNDNALVYDYCEITIHIC